MASRLIVCVSLLLSFIIYVNAQNSLMMMSSGSLSFPIDRIYQFGDSVSDTGNLIRLVPNGTADVCETYPYGESFFHYATGRCSDGLIMVDYYANAFGLPFVKPYLHKGANFSNGVVFSIGGSTALSSEYLTSLGITTNGNYSISTQLAWFREYLKSECSSDPECKNKLKRSLILMETIGGNDFGELFQGSSPFELAVELVPQVIRAIIDAVKEMIGLGAVNVVIPGSFPSGCMPNYLVLVNTTDQSLYDDLGCLIGFNKFAKIYNKKLQNAIQELQLVHPNVTLIYADYYTAIRSLLRIAPSLGFQEDILRTCCGNGTNPYNYNSDSICGTTGVPVCPDPSISVMWDGHHFTQRFYKCVADWMLNHTIIPKLSRRSYISI